MNIVQKILLGVRDPKQDAIQHEINRLCRKADTMGMYARAARETFENTGRESCLSAQVRYETSQVEAKAAEWKLRQQLGEGPQ